jgi:uncharacterized protein (DUF433 family)
MALRAEPEMLGFVLPNTVLVDQRYEQQRIKIESLYDEVELVALPDGTFNVSQANSALLIARKSASVGSQHLRSSVVFDSDRKSFRMTGMPSLTREVIQPKSQSPTGALWIPPSYELWRRLDTLPKLGSLVTASWGLRWRSGQKARTTEIPGPGRKLGFQDSASIHQFVLASPSWMDVRPEQLLAGGNLAWDAPKILCNATRLSRGYWRLAAVVDRLGRRATQQFMGVWPLPGKEVDLDALAAVLNGPVVNSFLTEHSFDKRFRIAAFLAAPIPAKLPPELGTLSREYAQAASQPDADPDLLSDKLANLDAMVLEAYGLERDDAGQLLKRMGDDDRPVVGRPSKRRRVKSREDGSLFPPDAEDIYSDPAIMGGEPVFRGTRVPVRAVAEMLEGGADTDELLEGYPSLNSKRLELARRWTKEHPPESKPKSPSNFVPKVISRRKVPRRSHDSGGTGGKGRS